MESIKQAIENDVLNGGKIPVQESPETLQQVAKTGLDLSFLKTPTGPGSIEDYIEHPFNIFKSRGLAQVLRGLTGLLGSLSFALVDILVGGLQFMRERRTENAGSV